MTVLLKQINSLTQGMNKKNDENEKLKVQIMALNVGLKAACEAVKIL